MSSAFLDSVRRVIRTLHYSIRTEQAYIFWIKRFILFNNKRHPAEMSDTEVGNFLSYLANERHVAAATQNQALNALNFFTTGYWISLLENSTVLPVLNAPSDYLSCLHTAR